MPHYYDDGREAREQAKQRPALTFDGFGINGPDEYRSRVAVFTKQDHGQRWGQLFAAAPDMLAALELLAGREHDCIESNPDEGPRCFFCGGDVTYRMTAEGAVKHEKDCAFVAVRAAIARAKGKPGD